LRLYRLTDNFLGWGIGFVITLKNISKSYQNIVLKNINWTIQSGEFVYVVGDSGAGKTTLLKLLYGEETPSGGSIEILGKSLLGSDSHTIQAVRRKIGVVFQDLRLIDELSVLDNVLLSLEVAEGTQKHHVRAIDHVLQQVGLQKFSKKKVKTLSGGEQARVAFARAFVRQPSVLIADEPTANLDQEYTWKLMDLFQKAHHRGTTVVLATHDKEIVRRLRSRACVLKDGKLNVESSLCFY